MSEPDTVCVWLSSLRYVRREIGHDALDAAERHRADTISHPGERERFVAARALLRHAVTEASQGAVTPAGWRFAADRRGKPKVADGYPPVPFSLSHAEDCIAVAVGRSAPLGVDVEGLWRETGSEVVRSVLTETERSCLSVLNPDGQWRRFIRLWTVKEACAKALGGGVAIDFASIEVGLDPLEATLGCAETAVALDAGEARIAGRRYHFAAAALLNGGAKPDFRLIPLED